MVKRSSFEPWLLHSIQYFGQKQSGSPLVCRLGNMLDDRMVRIAFMKASRVVHPDKTLRLPPDQRFLAKHIFDALSQANIK